MPLENWTRKAMPLLAMQNPYGDATAQQDLIEQLETLLDGATITVDEIMFPGSLMISFGPEDPKNVLVMFRNYVVIDQEGRVYQIDQQTFEFFFERETPAP